MVDFTGPDEGVSLIKVSICLTLVASLYPFVAALYNISPLHPLHSYPGPLLWRASRLPWIFALRSGYLHLRIKSFHDLYGPEVRIAPNEISYTNPQAWKDIYASKPRPDSSDSENVAVLERNPIWFKKAGPTAPWSIMGPNEAAHAKYRRAFMSAFTDKALRDYSSILESHIDLFIHKLQDHSHDISPLDLVSWFNFLTFDISGTLSFGESFGSTDAGRAHPWVAISCAFGKGTAMMASLNFLGLTSGPFGRFLKFAIPKAARERIMYHRQLTAEKVGHYLDSGSKKNGRAAFLDAALRFRDAAPQEQGEEVLTKSELDVNMSILVFAGSETTSSALSAATRYLLQNKHSLSKLVDEVRSSFTAERDITVHSVSKLEFLTACINESMRMSPPVVIGIPRVVPQGGAWICEKLVPAGTFVVLNQFPTYRSPTTFPDPNTFKPERFLSPSTSSPEAFQPFSLGRHQCIGQRLAWAEMRLVLARLLWAFDVAYAGDDGVPSDFAQQKTFIFWEKEALMVKLKGRRDV